MLAITLLYLGQFTFFTYLRPFLEQVTHVDVTMLTVMLLVVGVAGFVGTTLVGRVLDRSLFGTQAAIPAIMAAVAFALALFGASTWMTLVFLAIWGMASTAAPAGPNPIDRLTVIGKATDRLAL